MTMLTTCFLLNVLLGQAAVSPEQVRAQALHILNEVLGTNGSAKAEALQHLGRMRGDEPSQKLEDVLKGDDGTAIGGVAQGLSASQCETYLPQLKKAALNLRDANLQILACIGKVRTAETADALVQVANTLGDPMRGVAFGLLEKMGSVAEETLVKEVQTGPSASHRETAAYDLLNLRPAASATGFQIAIRDPDGRVRLAGAIGLAQRGSTAGQAILESAIDAPDQDDRIEALTSLSALGNSQAILKLRRIVTGADESARLKTVWAIARMGGPRLKTLAYELGLYNRPEFQGMLAERLLDPGNSHDASLLKVMLTSTNEVTRVIAAARLLEFRADARAQGVIAEALRSSDQPAARLALDAASGNSSFWPQLSELVDSADPLLQNDAIIAAGKLRQKDKFVLLKRFVESGSPALTWEAAESLAQIEPDAAKLLFEEGLKSTVAYVRVICSTALLTSSE